MDPIIFTDTSVKLDETTIKENNIFIINNEKSNLGQIIYTLDLMSNSGKILFICHLKIIFQN